jgi:hypothetical protein
MKTNDLKKGARVQLRNGWEAEIADNMKGNTRMAKVFGDYTEIGSVYSHDIMYAFVTAPLMDGPTQIRIKHTPAQLKCRQMNATLFG